MPRRRCRSTRDSRVVQNHCTSQFRGQRRGDAERDEEGLAPPPPRGVSRVYHVTGIGDPMATMASRQLPAHLLAPYVAAAARCVLDREQLDDVSKQAIAEAQLQLTAEESALRGSST